MTSDHFPFFSQHLMYFCIPSTKQSCCKSEKIVDLSSCGAEKRQEFFDFFSNTYE